MNDTETQERIVTGSDENPTQNSESSSLQKYDNEWNELYNNLNLRNLRNKSINGELRTSRFRSICWRLFLDVLPAEPLKWLDILKNMRCNYNKIKQGLHSNPWKSKYTDDDPLSQSEKSAWNQHFCDEELRSVITQDVVRTFPGIDFFRKISVQEIMVSVLFVYARQHPIMCYRQGMHELLGPLLFVFHYDHQAILHAEEQFIFNKYMKDILDPVYIEHDVYYLFIKIMASMESCYHINNVAPTASGYFPATTSPSCSPESNADSENEVVLQLNMIRDTLLQFVDPELCAHLRKLDISLPLFGIRWLRLLFGREFPLQDLLVLWDVIFAHGNHFKFVHFIVVAMLVAIRRPLLEGDYTTCLMYLMRYPTSIDVTYIIAYALHLQNPQKYPNPLKKSKQKSDDQGQHKKRLEINQKPLQVLKNQQLPKESTALISRPEKHCKDLDVLNNLLFNDPEKLMNELKHARNIMALSRLKLLQYHKVLVRAVPKTESYMDARSALDGISELCTLLTSTYIQLPADIEPALEAGEIRPNELHLKSDSRSQVSKSCIEEMKLFACTEGDMLLGVPMIDPIHRQH